MTEPSALATNSDTDSDAEPNTTDANIFWGHVKTPEKSRINNDIPQTILRPRSTLQIQSSESPRGSTSESLLKVDVIMQEEIENPQTTPIPSSIQTEDPKLDPAATWPGNLDDQKTNPTDVQEPGREKVIPSPEDAQNNVDGHNGAPDCALPLPDENVSATLTRDCSDTHNVPSIQVTTEFPVVLPVTPSNGTTCETPYPASQSHATPKAESHKEAEKVLNNLATPSPTRSVCLTTPRPDDDSPRRERRMKMKHDELRSRHPLLSLSPSSIDVLNLVQTPTQDHNNKFTFPESPTQKARRIPIPALSQRSPVKLPGLLRFPSPVKLDDPNRIPARRIPNLHSPLRTIQNNDALIHSPPRRIPINKNREGIVSSTVSNTIDQMVDVFASTLSSVPFKSRPGHPPESSTVHFPGSPLKFVVSPGKAADFNPGSSAVKAGSSKLPVLSSRSVARQPPPSLLPVRKRFDPVIGMPSRIPSPTKRDIENRPFTSKPQHPEQPLEQFGSKRKRTDNESGDELEERPHKRTTTQIQPGFQKMDNSSLETPCRVVPGTSIQKTIEPIHHPHRPDAEIETTTSKSSASTLQAAVTDLSRNSSASGSSTLHVRRTSRVRKPKAIIPDYQSGKSTRSGVRSLPSQKDPVPKALPKLPARPPSRSASRAGNLDGYPENPRQLQWLTSINTQLNQEPLASLEHQVVRKPGNRPPSPSSKFRIDPDKSREEREARAERRQRRDRSNEPHLVPDITQSLETIASSSKPIDPTKHMRGPGDDEDYETPTKVPKPTAFHPDRMTKMVKWSKTLVDTSRPPGSNSSEQSGSTKFELKSCFLREPATLALDVLGNMPNADEPISGLVKEHIIVSRFIYDDDIQESPRRSKKKLG